MNIKKENFKRIAEARTNKIIHLISLLGNLSNRSFYEFSNEEIDTIFKALEDKIKTERLKFDQTKEKRFKLWLKLIMHIQNLHMR